MNVSLFASWPWKGRTLPIVEWCSSFMIGGNLRDRVSPCSPDAQSSQNSSQTSASLDSSPASSQDSINSSPAFLTVPGRFRSLNVRLFDWTWQDDNIIRSPPRYNAHLIFSRVVRISKDLTVDYKLPRLGDGDWHNMRPGILPLRDAIMEFAILMRAPEDNETDIQLFPCLFTSSIFYESGPLCDDLLQAHDPPERRVYRYTRPSHFDACNPSQDSQESELEREWRSRKSPQLSERVPRRPAVFSLAAELELG